MEQLVFILNKILDVLTKKRIRPLYYNTVVLAYATAQKIDLDNRCNGITVKNAGTTQVIIDDEILQPGESKAIGGNLGEIFIGRKDIYFQVPTPAPAVITNLAYVTVKFYVPVPDAGPNYVKEL